MILLSFKPEQFYTAAWRPAYFLFVLVITYFTTKWIGGYQKVRCRTQLSGGRYHTDRQQQTGSGNKMGDVYLVIAVAKDNVTMLAKLTEEEMGLTEAEICNGKTRTEWRKRSDDLPGDA